MTKRGCPKNQAKAKGRCRTAEQKAGDRHRKLVLQGKAKPYSEGGRRGVSKTKRKSSKRGAQRKGGVDYWCAPSRASIRTRNDKWTMCDLRKHQMNSRKQLRAGPGGEFGPMFKSGAFQSSVFNTEPSIFEPAYDYINNGKRYTGGGQVPAISDEAMVPASGFRPSSKGFSL